MKTVYLSEINNAYASFRLDPQKRILISIT